MLDKGGRAIGVDFGDEKIYSDTIVLAIGAFALKLPDILPGDESERIAGNFTITQRELFFAQTPGVQDTNFFLISPDMVPRVCRRAKAMPVMGMQQMTIL